MYDQITGEVLADLARHAAKGMHDRLHLTLKLVDVHPASVALMVLDTMTMLMGEAGGAVMILADSPSETRENIIDAIRLGALVAITRTENPADWEVTLKMAVNYFGLLYGRPPRVDIAPFLDVVRRSAAGGR